jgi:hypothetical protein
VNQSITEGGHRHTHMGLKKLPANCHVATNRNSGCWMHSPRLPSALGKQNSKPPAISIRQWPFTCYAFGHALAKKQMVQACP